MTDPKHEPVAYRFKHEHLPDEWKYATHSPKSRPWHNTEGLYPASTIEALTAQLDALKEENKRLKDPSPQTDVEASEYRRGVRDGVEEALWIATEQARMMADYAIEGLSENARNRESMEAALTRFSHSLRVTLEGLSRPMADRKFKEGDFVRKKSGSWWEGRVVGFYSTEQSPDGVAVQLDKPMGPVQIYPASALEIAPAPQPNVLTQPQLPESGESVEGGE